MRCDRYFVAQKRDSAPFFPVFGILTTKNVDLKAIFGQETVGSACQRSGASVPAPAALQVDIARQNYFTHKIMKNGSNFKILYIFRRRIAARFR